MSAPKHTRILLHGLWLVAAVSLASLALIDHLPFASTQRGSRVAFLDNGLLDFDRPRDYSPESGSDGMFGSLLDYLEMMGFSAERTRGPFTSESLANADILVVINPFYKWSAHELAAINGWVRNGGALLVLGDHTDLGGMNQSLNPLLEQFGARLNFETGDAHKAILRHGWRLGYHPALFGVDYYSKLYWGTGGTLTVSLPFEPLVEGAYAFGDAGDYAADSYFGNRSYDRGETAGDIVLAAIAQPGRGKVAVFADTSPFLNGTIHLSFHPFLYHFFRSLQRGSRIPNPYLLRWIGGGLLGLMVVFSGRLLGIPMLRLAIIAVLVILSLNRHLAAIPLAPANPDSKLALLDLSHIPRWATDPFQDHSIDGAAAVLSRSGHLPAAMWAFDDALISHAGILMINQPARPYSARQEKVIYDWVRAGGVLVAAGSYETPDAVNELVAPLGLQINKTPLGTTYVEVDQSGAQEYVEIPNTAPIGYHDPSGAAIARFSAKVVAQNEGYPVVVTVQLGQGRVMLIGSDRFLTSESLQDKNNPRRGVNVSWLERLLRETTAEIPK